MYYTFKSQVPLRPGEALGFVAGRGYYAYYPTAASKTTGGTEGSSSAGGGGGSAGGGGGGGSQGGGDDGSQSGTGTGTGGAGAGGGAGGRDSGRGGNAAGKNLGVGNSLGRGITQATTVASGRSRVDQTTGERIAGGKTNETKRGQSVIVPSSPRQLASSAGDLQIVEHPSATRARLKPFNRAAELAYVAQYNGQSFGKSSSSGYNREYNVARSVWDEVKTAVGVSNSQDDCTNFVSQALFAGGWQQTPEWNYHAKHYVVATSDVPLVGGVVTIKSQREGSPAWQAVANFKKFALDSGRAVMVPLSKAERGDVILADWTGGQPGTDKFRPIHAMILVG